MNYISGAWTHFREASSTERLTSLGTLAAAVPLGAACAFQFINAVQQVWLFILSRFTCSLRVTDKDAAYEYIAHWLSTQQKNVTSTSLLAVVGKPGKVTHSWGFIPQEQAVIEPPLRDSDEDLALAAKDFDTYWTRRIQSDKSEPMTYIPGPGHHILWYKRWIPVFIDCPEEDRMKGHFVDLRCLGRDGRIIKEILQEAQTAFTEVNGDETIIYRNGDGRWADSWTKTAIRIPRSMSTVILDDIQKAAIIADIREYLHPLTRKWYLERGIPWRRGYMLSGPPGTGKTSLCFALASLFKLPIYLTSLSNITEHSLSSLFTTLPTRSIILLEDIDATGSNVKKREDETDKDKTTVNKEAELSSLRKSQGLSLSALLNAIDGIVSSEGRILIMTTNHIDHLDPALLRPGRVDMTIHFENISARSAQNFFKSFYSTSDIFDTTSTAIKSYQARKLSSCAYPETEHDLERLAHIFSRSIPAGEISPAELQGYLLRYKYRPDKAISNVENWVEELRREKKIRSGTSQGPVESIETNEDDVLVKREDGGETGAKQCRTTKARSTTRARSKSAKPRTRKKDIWALLP